MIVQAKRQGVRVGWGALVCSSMVGCKRGGGGQRTAVGQVASGAPVKAGARIVRPAGGGVPSWVGRADVPCVWALSPGRGRGHPASPARSKSERALLRALRRCTTPCPCPATHWMHWSMKVLTGATPTWPTTAVMGRQMLENTVLYR